MTKIQLDNLLRFCFNFHVSMDNNIHSNSPDYLLEKWDKYIGVTPIPDESINYDIIKNRTLKTLDGNTELVLNTWIFTWDDRISSPINGFWYNKVKEILKFISILNTRPLTVSSKVYIDSCWSPGEIIEEFRLHIGDPNKINKEPYRHLHTLVKDKIDEWLEYKVNKRDYKLCALV